MKENLIAKARELMDQHGLHEWSFRIDTAKTRMGACWHRKRQISLSEKHINFSREDEVIDTILHEIAHALVGRKHGHNKVWKDMCVKIGARPNRCAKIELGDNFYEDAPWVGVCESCQSKWGRYRKPSGSCYYTCAKCKCSVKFKFKEI